MIKDTIIMEIFPSMKQIVGCINKRKKIINRHKLKSIDRKIINKIKSNNSIKEVSMVIEMNTNRIKKSK